MSALIPKNRERPAFAAGPSGPALEQVLRQLLPDLRNWMARFLGPGLDVDDAAQDALIELASALRSFRGDSSIRTYAYRIAIRVASRHRARRTRPLEPTLTLVHDDADPEFLLNQRQSLAALYDALDRLVPNQREALILCAIEGLAHAEAAEVLDIDIEALRQRLKRGRAQLRDALRGHPLLGSMFSDAPSSEEAT